MQKVYRYLFLLLLLTNSLVFSQLKNNKQSILLDFKSADNKISVQQQLKTTSSISTDTLYFYAWANAYSNKNTELSKRFLENYKLDFQFARKSKLGKIEIDTIYGNKNIKSYQFLRDKPDILQVVFKEKLNKNDSINLSFHYDIYLPSNKFTGYGIDKKNNILLDNFYFSPFVYPLQFYSNNNLDDRPENPTDFEVKIKHLNPKKRLYSNIKSEGNNIIEKQKRHLKILITDDDFENFFIDNISLDIYKKSNKIDSLEKRQLLLKILGFYKKIYGKIPFSKILITKKDLQNNPVYGFDLLPKFLNPYDEKFVWELSMLHQIGLKFANQLLIDKRQQAWLYFAISSYPEFEYLEQYYPNRKLSGKLSKYKILKYYYFSQMNILEKYPIFYDYMARMNKDQKLTTPLNLMSNFNKDVALPYKTVLGFVMLEDQMKQTKFQSKLKEFYNDAIKHNIDSQSFYNQFSIDKNHWFYNYITTRQKYDYKLKILSKTGDGINLKIKNKLQGQIPLNLYRISKNKISKIKTLSPVKKDTTFTVYNQKNTDWIGVNYFNYYPEIQIYNNFKKVKQSLFGKPLQFRLFQDFENPLKHQLFLNPFFQYNYYDGIILGSQIYNMKMLHNNFDFSVSPSYSLKAKTISGSFGITYRQYFENLKPYTIKYGINGAYYHYNHDLTYKKINPYTVIELRNKNLRKREGSNIAVSFLSIDKQSINDNNKEQNHYKILNLSFQKFKVNIIKDHFLTSELQLSDKFGKLVGKYRIRWLTDKTRQWDFRFFAGVFLYNKTQSDYFSFALDRPTDYLFRYNYYGRSENSGIFQQQFIWAEGGFKTFFKNQFANQWIVSNNMNIGIWKWFNLYGDIAFKKNKNENPKFYYDSGLRINLVQDYFEIFFPVYSSLGNELKSPEYYKKIRLVFTIDLNHLMKMYSRGWY